MLLFTLADVDIFAVVVDAVVTFVAVVLPELLTPVRGGDIDEDVAFDACCHRPSSDRAPLSLVEDSTFEVGIVAYDENDVPPPGVVLLVLVVDPRNALSSGALDDGNLRRFGSILRLLRVRSSTTVDVVVRLRPRVSDTPISFVMLSESR